jgi:hypothetical protein
MSDHSDFMREAATFAENVRRELRTLPAETVADLTDGLEADIASSLSDGATLPSVSEYACDLMRGAGLEVPDETLVVISWRMKAEAAIVKCVDKLSHATKGLAPAWWFLRAWVVTQFLGGIISDTDSTRPLIGQWGEMPIVGLVVLAISIVVSVQRGRRAAINRQLFRVVTTSVLCLATIPLLLWEPTQVEQSDGNWSMSAPETCRIIDVPFVVGLTLGEAESAFKLKQIPYVIFDQDAMTEIAYASDDFEVLQQDLAPGDTTFCSERQVQLVVDLSQNPGESATSLPGTTTIPESSTTTTVKPKATTTTTP